MYAIFSSSFTTYLEDFVDVVIVWIAPWVAIFLVDWALRRFRYVPSELQNTGRTSLYWNSGGVFWPAIIAQLIGMFAAISALSATFSLPHWLNEVTYHNNGADFSVFLGIGVGGGVYYLLAHAQLSGKRTRRSSCFERKGCCRPSDPTGVQSAPVLDEIPEEPTRNSGMLPSVRTRPASSPSARFHPPPSVMRVPMTTGSACMRRTSRRAEDSEAPVEMTSSTTATRRPRTASTRAGSIRRRCGVSVVME